MEGGMVLDSLLNTKECRYTEDDARGVIKQVLEGLQYLHQRYRSSLGISRYFDFCLFQKCRTSRFEIGEFAFGSEE